MMGGKPLIIMYHWHLQCLSLCDININVHTLYNVKSKSLIINVVTVMLFVIAQMHHIVLALTVCSSIECINVVMTSAGRIVSF